MASRVVMPKLTDTMEEGVLLKWYKKEGERVESGDPIAEVETDKAVMDLEAFASGILKKILVEPESVVPAGDLIAIIAREDESIDEILAKESPPRARKRGAAEKVAPTATASKPAEREKPEERPAPPGEVKASPLAKRIAEERGIDLSKVAGTGPGGRITQKDITGQPLETGAQSYEEYEPSQIRKAIAKRMVASKAPVPHFYVTSEIDMTRTVTFMEELAEPAQGVKVTLTSILVKACAIALKKFPMFRASYVDGRIRIYDRYDVGIAVGMEDGLLIAVLRGCDRKTLGQIAIESKELVRRARAKALKPQEYTQEVFAISNLGMYDVESFSAIITPPDSSALAVGSLIERPVVKEGVVSIAKTMKVTLSVDHRVADGVQAAQFLQEVKRILENPIHLAL